MKHLPVAGKALTVLFTAAFLVACSSSDTKEDEAAAAGSPSRIIETMSQSLKRCPANLRMMS